MNAWSGLPPEIFIQIISHLSEDDQVSCSGVSFCWNYWINGHLLSSRDTVVLRPEIPFLEFDKIKRVHLVGYHSAKDLDDILDIQPILAQEVYVSFEKKKEVDVQWIRSLTDSIQDTVTVLWLKNIILSEENKQFFLEIVPLNIETLVIDVENDDFSVYESASELFSSLFLINRNKVKCIFSGAKVKKIIHMPRNVDVLECDCPGLYRSQYIYLIQDSLKKCESISFKGAGCMNADFLFRLSQMTNLKILKISDAECINDMTWKDSFERGFETLENLEITNCKGISDLSVRAISDKLNLKHLNLETFHAFDESIALLLSLDLKSLTLHISLSQINSVMNSFKGIYPFHSIKIFVRSPFEPNYGVNIPDLDYEMFKLKNCFKDLGSEFSCKLNFTKTSWERA